MAGFTGFEPIVTGLQDSLTYMEEQLESLGCFRSDQELAESCGVEGRLAALKAFALRDPHAAHWFQVMGFEDIIQVHTKLQLAMWPRELPSKLPSLLNGEAA